MKMNRFAVMYGAMLAALLVAGIVGVRLSLLTGDRAALRKLGRAEREYQEARRELLLTSSDASPAIIRFVNDNRNSERARLQALRILGELAQHQKLEAGGARLAALLDDDVREIRLAALEALAAMESPDGMDAVVELFRRETDTALVQRAIDAQAGASELLRKRLDVAMHTGDTAAVESCLALVETIPVGKGVVYPDIGDYFRRVGDIERGAGYYRRMGTIRTWWVVGPFDNQRMEGWAKDYGPESTPFDPAQTFAISDREEAHWFPLRRVSDRWGVWLAGLFPKDEYAVAYLFAYVHVPSARDALVLCGSDDAIKVWCNDSLVWANRVFRGVARDDDVVKVRLHEGVNTLLLKVIQDVGGWGVFCRLADMQGEAMDDVVVSLDRELRPNPAERIITCLEQSGEDCWNPDSMDIGDVALQQTVIAAIRDQGAHDSRRVAALGFLEQLNAHRRTPAGERELIEIASAMAERGRGSALLGRIAESLHRMQTRRALDLGLALRTLDTPAMTLAGNRLVSSYCKHRLIGLGDPMQLRDTALVQRTLQDVASLRPTDPWVLHRCATLQTAIGDTDGARKIVTGCGMPRRWYVSSRARPYANISAADFTAAAGPDSVSFVSPSPPSSVGAWQLVDVAPDNASFGVYADLAGLRLPGGEAHAVLACTEVHVSGVDSCLLAVSVPAPWRLWVNGVEVRDPSEDAESRYHRLIADYAQPRRFDMELCPVKLRRGRNTIGIAFSGKRFGDAPEPYVRCSVRDLSGRPLGCDG
ncbi:MAG: hypothetical protein GF331_15505, partial [Chitinivibrionales bacterium]|nr:hypothetical protein [Chitinivibrionales bacterium]